MWRSESHAVSPKPPEDSSVTDLVLEDLETRFPESDGM